MTFNVHYSDVSEGIQYITRRIDRKNENYLLFVRFTVKKRKK